MFILVTPPRSNAARSLTIVLFITYLTGGYNYNYTYD